jgi:hypothetical protein
MDDTKRTKQAKAGYKAGPAAAPQHLGGTSPPAEGPALFEEVKARVATRPKSDRAVLLSVPIWGWTGDGKTCALLTALHYADAVEHALSLAYVTDIDELAELEREAEVYKGLNLAAVAAATKVRLTALRVRESGSRPISAPSPAA